MRKLLYLSSIVALSMFVACSDDEPLDEVDEQLEMEDDMDGTATVEETFGIRHDLNLTDYESIGANNAPYTGDNYPDFSSVVAFSYTIGEDEFVASGTLIADNWILTAGHNFFSSDEQTEPVSVSDIVVLTGSDPNNPTGEYEVASLVFSPTWLQDDRLFESGNDLCLVELSAPIAGLTPASLLESEIEENGSEIWVAGYGDYSSQPGQDEELLSKRHAVHNVLDRTVTGIVTSVDGETFVGGLLAFDFDDPDGLVNSFGDDVQNLDESLLGDGTSEAGALDFEGTTVEGDSGAPLFIQIDGNWYVAGVLSGGATDPIANHDDSGYGDISIFIRVATSIDWINGVID